MFNLKDIVESRLVKILKKQTFFLKNKTKKIPAQ